MLPLTYLDEYRHSVENLPYLSRYELQNIETLQNIDVLQNTGNILAITDPSKANIYIDGIIQPQLTSILITNIPVGNHTVQFTKAGYAPYTDTVNIKKNVTTTVAAILTQMANIDDKGIVICTGLNISTCPISPLSCPILITPLDYVNMIAIITSTSPLSLTVRFIHTLDGIQNYTDVPVNLAIGNNIVYAFPTNIQYPPNSILSLDDVILI